MVIMDYKCTRTGSARCERVGTLSRYDIRKCWLRKYEIRILHRYILCCRWTEGCTTDMTVLLAAWLPPFLPNVQTDAVQWSVIRLHNKLSIIKHRDYPRSPKYELSNNDYTKIQNNKIPKYQQQWVHSEFHR